jgi:hypothetical protein
VTNLQDAVNVHIQYYEKLKTRSADIWIKVLKSAPRDLAEVQKVIDRKVHLFNTQTTPEDADLIYTEIQALEWIRIMLRDSDKEQKNWNILFKG